MKFLKTVEYAMVILLFFIGDMAMWEGTGRMVSSPSDIGFFVGMFMYVFGFAAFIGFVVWGARVFSRDFTLKTILVVCLMTATFLGCTRVDPGHVGIKINYYG